MDCIVEVRINFTDRNHLRQRNVDQRSDGILDPIKVEMASCGRSRDDSTYVLKLMVAISCLVSSALWLFCEHCCCTTETYCDVAYTCIEGSGILTIKSQWWCGLWSRKIQVYHKLQVYDIGVILVAPCFTA